MVMPRARMVTGRVLLRQTLMMMSNIITETKRHGMNQSVLDAILYPVSLFEKSVPSSRSVKLWVFTSPTISSHSRSGETRALRMKYGIISPKNLLTANSAKLSDLSKRNVMPVRKK